MDTVCYDKLQSARHKLEMPKTSVDGLRDALGNRELQVWLEHAASILRTSLNDINNVLKKKAPGHA